MKFRRTSPYSGKVNEIELPLSEDQFKQLFAKWQTGELIQEVFYMLTPNQREFIATGLLPEEWDAMYVTPDDDELEEELDDEDF